MFVFVVLLLPLLAIDGAVDVVIGVVHQASAAHKDVSSIELPCSDVRGAKHVEQNVDKVLGGRLMNELVCWYSRGSKGQPTAR